MSVDGESSGRCVRYEKGVRKVNQLMERCGGHRGDVKVVGEM